MLYANWTFLPHWNHMITSRCSCHFRTIDKRPWTIAVQDRHGRLRNISDWLHHTRLISVNPTILPGPLLIDCRGRALKSQFISRWDLHFWIGQHHYKWSKTVRRIPGGPGLINEILLSRLQAGMFRPNGNGTVRLHCAWGRLRALWVLIFWQIGLLLTVESWK